VAIAKVADRATANSNSAVTTVDLSLSGLTVGNVLIIRAAADNSGTNGAARTFVASNFSGTALNVTSGEFVSYTRNTDPGAANEGTTCFFRLYKITGTSGTVRMTYSGSVVQALVAEEWSGITSWPGNYQGTGASGTASTNLASATQTGCTAGMLIYGVQAVEGPASDTITGDADTTNGSWNLLTEVGTSNATAAANQTTFAQYKIATGSTNQTFNPTINNARDSAGIIVRTWPAPEFAAPLGALTATAAATATGSSSTVYAVAAAPLGAVTGTATATPEHPATAVAPLGSLTGTAAATPEHPAVLAAPLGGLTGSASATVEHPASADSPLGALTGTAAATVTHPAVVSAQLGSAAATATATVTHLATLAAPLGAVDAASSATVTHPATVAAALGDLAATATAEPTTPPATVTATAAADLGGLTAQATATPETPAPVIEGPRATGGSSPQHRPHRRPATRQARAHAHLGHLAAHATAAAEHNDDDLLVIALA